MTGQGWSGLGLAVTRRPFPGVHGPESPQRSSPLSRWQAGQACGWGAGAADSTSGQAPCSGLAHQGAGWDGKGQRPSWWCTPPPPAKLGACQTPAQQAACRTPGSVHPVGLGVHPMSSGAQLVQTWGEGQWGQGLGKERLCPVPVWAGLGGCLQQTQTQWRCGMCPGDRRGEPLALASSRSGRQRPFPGPQPARPGVRRLLAGVLAVPTWVKEPEAQGVSPIWKWRASQTPSLHSPELWDPQPSTHHKGWSAARPSRQTVPFCSCRHRTTKTSGWGLVSSSSLTKISAG